MKDSPAHASRSDWLSSTAGRVFSNGWREMGIPSDVVELATGKKLGSVGVIGARDLSRATGAANEAQADWAATQYDHRARILRVAGDLTQQHRGQIVDWLVRESGSIRAKAEFEVEVTSKALYRAAAMPFESPGELLPTFPGRLSMARRVPIGVVGVIAPFNFPLYLAMRAVAPALAVGNAVVLKPDPRTAVCGGIVVAKIFELAGLPDGVLHVLPGHREVGEAMCTDPHIDMIQFTGSTAAGRAVARLAGEHLKKVSLELGGKNSLIVLDDADLDLAVSNARWSVYLHQGQICMSAGRILVHEKVAAEFLRRMVQRAEQTPVGDPTLANVLLGPMIGSSQVEHVLHLIRDSVAAGAKLLAGGTCDGLFLRPTVLAAVRPGMPAYDQEIFGPVAVVSTFGSDDEAVQMANDTPFGLSAAVISSSIGRALSMGDRLNVGLLHINDQTVNDEVVNPFGGTGHSGNGTSIGGPANWDLFSHWQWLTIKATPPAYPL